MSYDGAHHIGSMGRGGSKMYVFYDPICVWKI